MQISVYAPHVAQTRACQPVPLIAPDDRLRRLARQLHRLGERPLYEFLRELAAGADPVARLEVYARIDPQVLAIMGGNDLPPDRGAQR